MHWKFCLALLLSTAVLSLAQLQIDLSDELAFVTLQLDVISQQRAVTLGFGRTYRIGCQDGTSPGMWNATIMISNSEPQNSSTTAAYLLDQGNKLVLRIQNFDASLAGEYICFSANGEQKRLIIVAGNPSLIVPPQQLFFSDGETLSAGERFQRILVTGVPEPTIQNYTWTLNETISLKDDPEFSIENIGLELPEMITYDHSGIYTLVVTTSAGTISESFTVSVGVGPSVTMSSTANPSLLEQSLRLTCVDSQGIPPPEFTWQKCVGSRDTNCRSLPNEDDNGDVLSPSSNTSVLTIESVGLDDGAYYKCEGRNAYGNIIAFQNIPVAVPPAQSVVIATSTSPPYTAGNSLQLTCTATLPDLSLNSANISAQINWRKGEIPLNISNHRISVVDQQTGGSSRVQQLTIDPLSDHLDSGDYVCDVIFSVIGTDIVSPLVSSAETPITVEVPSMIVEVNPSSVSALDVSPFNQVLLNCSITNLDALNLSNLLLEYSWHNGSSELFHGQDGVSIIDNAEIETSSSFSLTASQASLFTVYCKVKIMLKKEELFSIEQGSEVTIRGPSRPDPPRQVSTSERFNQAVVQVTIPKIRYTPESYYIRYGLDPNNLELRSETVGGSQDVTTLNNVITITLSHLQHNRQYYYAVVAMNSEGEVTSASFMFQTHALVLMQVRAGPFEGCRASQVQQATAVSAFFKKAIVDAINSRCFCDFPSDNLINSSIVCPEDGSRDLVYRAYIVRLDHLSSNQLLTYVDSWVKQEPYVTTGVAVIRFNPNCTSSVSSSIDSICSPLLGAIAPQATFGTNEIYIVAATAVGGLLLLLMLIIIILSCYIFSQKKQIRSLRMKKKATYAVTRVRRESSVSGTGESASGFADLQGANWNKGISVMDCPAYGSYTTVKPRDKSCTAVIYDHTKEDPTTCIYDSIHDITEAPANISNRRIAMTNCAAFEKETEAMEEESDTEDTTVGSVV